jgi:hypothetical protein
MANNNALKERFYPSAEEKAKKSHSEGRAGLKARFCQG